MDAFINKLSHFLGFVFYIEIATIHLGPAGQMDSQVVAKNGQDELELGGQRTRILLTTTSKSQKTISRIHSSANKLLLQ